MASETVLLPDLLARWPWPRQINPKGRSAAILSSNWLQSFKPFKSSEAQLAFDQCDFGLLASLAYPTLSFEGVLTGCDLMNLFFVLDEHSDKFSGPMARESLDAVKAVFQGKLRTSRELEWVGATIARDFWSRAQKHGNQYFEDYFTETFIEYLDAVVDEAADRTLKHVRNVVDFLSLRRRTIGARPSFALLLLLPGMNQSVIENPIIRRLEHLCIDMLCLGNDVVSYAREIESGNADHNIITVACHEYGFNTSQSFHFAAEMSAQREKEFIALTSLLAVNSPEWHYAECLGNWVRANDQWSYESARYFGDRGLEVMKTRRAIVRRLTQ
ncbi:terpenoid synthase [Stachybotrys elegans]|uniref:Terpene synthase n=1 Tax=Stachybotrys elegans TaxID=80388 RepID=A0A8K0SV54_9HYPO|nr:terpenoid synthase [Stachybotrys elegans]